MLQKTLTISSYTYLVEYYSADNEQDHKITKNMTDKYLFLRSYDFVNNVATDKVIYVISFDDFRKIQNKVKDEGTDINDIIVFPSGEDTPNLFSRSYYNFNNNFTKESFYNEEHPYAYHDNENAEYAPCHFESITKYKDILSGNAVYPIYTLNRNNSTGIYEYDIANIKTDIVRIYHPQTKSSLQAFVCIDNYINNIHFIYICQTLDSLPIDSYTEQKFGHNVYSEYKYIMVPNLYSLFNDNTFYIENLNAVNIISSKNDGYLKDNDYRYILYDSENDIVNQFLCMKLMLHPWRLDSFEDDELLYQKTFIKEFFRESELSYPLTVSIYPYDEYTNDEIKNIPEYSISNEFTPSSVTFQPIHIFRLQAMFSFDDTNSNDTGVPIIHTVFRYPTILDPNGIQYDLEDTYCKYYNIHDKTIYNKDNYSNFLDESLTKYINELERLKNLNTIDKSEEEKLHRDVSELSVNDKKVIYFELKEKNLPTTDINIMKMYYQLKIDSSHETNNEELESDLNFIGYKIDIASDLMFKNILYTTYQQPIPEYTLLTEDDAYEYNLLIDGTLRIGDPVYWTPGEVSLYNIQADEMGGDIAHIDTNTVKYVIETKQQANEYNSKNFEEALKEGDRILNDYKIGISDFDFRINGIFKSWDELPDVLACRTYFIDRFIGTYMMSNIIIITKEWYKYLVNNINKYKLLSLYSDWNDNTENIKEMKTIYAQNPDLKNKQSFNFIDKVSCIVQKNDEFKSNNISAKQKIILYKPIFFKVNDIQNIRIRNNVVQSIALNLYIYMSKVSTFMLMIDNVNFIESKRIDNNIIFDINGASITHSSGTYDLYGDSQYINSGHWEKIL